MSIRLRSLPVLLLFWGLLGCSTDEPQPMDTDPTVYVALGNVSYGNDPKQVYDIYLPKNRSTSTKVLILVHGGGWNEGDKTDMNGFRDVLREKFPQMAVVNMNYRLATEGNGPYPMQINDITAVVSDLKDKQTQYQIGTDLGFIGVSAGGHLSLLWSYAHDTQKQVKMVCSIVGPTNLADDAYINSSNQELKDLIFQFGTAIDELQLASPLHVLQASAPPTILFCGAQDPLVPVSQGTDLDAKLNGLAVEHEFTLYPNGGHGWIGLDLLDTSIKLENFIKTHF